MLQLDTNYDSPGYDGTANMSYRNILEGFANPNDGIAGSKIKRLIDFESSLHLPQ